MKTKPCLRTNSLCVYAVCAVLTASALAAEKEEVTTPVKEVRRTGMLVDDRSGKDYLQIGKTDVRVTTISLEGRLTTNPAGAKQTPISAEAVHYTVVEVHGRDKFVEDAPYEYAFAKVGEDNGATFEFGDLLPKKRFIQKELSVALYDGKEIPVPLLEGCPFPCRSLKVEGKLIKPITITISDAKGDLLIPSESSLVPVTFQPFGFMTCAEQVTWKFTKPGISWTSDGVLYRVEKEGATLSFDPKGVSLNGIVRSSK